MVNNRNDKRKNPHERRANERRKNWEGVKQLGLDADFWRFEGRRKYGYDQRKKPSKRVIKDRRRNERRKHERRGDPLSRPSHHSRYLSPQVAEARAVSGGVKRDRISLVSPEKLAEPTSKYKPPVSSSLPVRQNPEESNLSPLEATFPGFTTALKSAGRAVRRRWNSMRN